MEGKHYFEQIFRVCFESVVFEFKNNAEFISLNVVGDCLKCI